MEPEFQRIYNLNMNAGNQGANIGNQPMLLSPQEYRAKLYWLDNENKWQDMGTGRFRILLSKDNEEHYIQIVSEDGIDNPSVIEDENDEDQKRKDLFGDDNQEQLDPDSEMARLREQQTRDEKLNKQVFLHRCFFN